MNRPTADGSADDSPGASVVSRRRLLAAGSGLLVGLAGCSGIGDDSGSPVGPPTSASPTSDAGTTTAETPTPPWLAEFAVVHDAVADLDCDPDGEEPCDDAIDSAVGPDVAIRFPAGTYRFDRSHRYEGFERLGFAGVGDVTFVPPAGFNDKLFSLLGGRVRFESIDIDVSESETTAGLRFIADQGFEVADVEFRGRGLHPDSEVVNALALAVRDPDGTGRLRNFVARRGSAIGHYKGGNGRVGIWVGDRHRGTVEIRDCHLAEFGNNGIYGSRCHGQVEVVGGRFHNNNVCGVRLGGGGSLVRGAEIVVDLGRYDGPYTLTNSSYDTRAIVVEQGSYDKSGRVLIEDVDVRLVNADRSQGAIVTWPTGNGPRIVNSDVAVDVEWVSAIQGVAPESSVAEADRGIELVGSTLTGEAAWGSAVELVDRPGSVIEGTTIDQAGPNRDGLRIVGSNPTTLLSSSVTTTRHPLFAVNPRDAGGTCILYVTGDSNLDRSGPPVEDVQSAQLSDADVDVPGGVPDGHDLRCIGDEVAADLATFEGVGITDVESDTVTWRRYADIETTPRGRS